MRIIPVVSNFLAPIFQIFWSVGLLVYAFKDVKVYINGFKVGIIYAIVFITISALVVLSWLIGFNDQLHIYWFSPLISDFFGPSYWGIMFG